jgi:hypothetical protein
VTWWPFKRRPKSARITFDVAGDELVCHVELPDTKAMGGREATDLANGLAMALYTLGTDGEGVLGLTRVSLGAACELTGQVPLGTYVLRVLDRLRVADHEGRKRKARNRPLVKPSEAFGGEG